MTLTRKRTMLIGLVVAAVTLIALPFSRHELHWRWITLIDDADGYTAYLASWPDGGYVHDANARLDEFDWDTASTEHTVDALGVYLSKHKNGAHRQNAERIIDTLRWQAAKEQNTTRSYANYLRTCEHGAFRTASKNRIDVLRADDRPYRDAVAQNSYDAMKEFVRDFPGHLKGDSAAAIIADMDGKDIVDMMREGKVRVRTSGSGIEDVSVQIRKRVPHNLRVTIPVGTYFVCRGSAQNMVGTETKTVHLRDDDWHDVSIAAACANRTRSIPRDDDSFSIRRSPHQKELAMLAKAIEGKAHYNSDVMQAAVWIVTDNADYDDLGILQRRHQWDIFGEGTRVINEREAAQAMQLCDAAGIDIKRKAVWRDRRTIAKGLEDGELKTWLASK